MKNSSLATQTAAPAMMPKPGTWAVSVMSKLDAYNHTFTSV